MEQILQSLNISTFDTSGSQSKNSLLDKKYTIDSPMSKSFGSLKLNPNMCSCSNEFYELKNVNFVLLFSDSPFTLIINDLIKLNTNQFTFYNPIEIISVSIPLKTKKILSIDYIYGTISCNQQNVAVTKIEQTSGTTWDKVLKNIVIDTNCESEFTFNE